MRCTLCPRHCLADRQQNGVGYCGASSSLKVARAALHFWEEPPISGEKGSGTVFFSHCPLKCVYCQNSRISKGGDGLEISVARLCEIFFELKEKGAHNINLVSPTQYANEIVEAISMAKSKGFDLPFVYNTSGYESTETLKRLQGLVDIYLTDFKYASADNAKRYSNAADYPPVAEKALSEMMAQQPLPVYEGELMKKGVIVRHLILPGNTADSKDVVDIFDRVCGDRAILSLMWQFTPQKSCALPELSRKVSEEEYNEVVNYALMCGIKNIFLQENESASESFIPAFDYEGVLTK